MKARTEAQKTELVLKALKAGPWAPPGGWDAQGPRETIECVVSSGAQLRTMPLWCVIVEQLERAQPDTVRGVMYSVVSCGWLPDTGESSYGKVQRPLNILRKIGIIPFGWITDNIRETNKPSSWSGLADYAETVRDCYRLDFWAGLPDYVCIIVEKDTVAGRVAPVTREYDVPLHPLRGFSSTTFAHGIAQEWRKIKKPIHAYYIGDHDPSGRDIERSIRAGLKEWCEKDFNWTRLAVEPEHFEEFDIIPLEPKEKDSRYRKFLEQFGERCAEVEAVPAETLRRMVRDAICQHIPGEQWRKLKTIESQEKRTWIQMLDRLKAA